MSKKREEICVVAPEENRIGWIGGKQYYRNLRYALKHFAPEISIYSVPEEKSRLFRNRHPHYILKFVEKAVNFLIEYYQYDPFMQKKIERSIKGQIHASINLIKLKPSIAKIAWIPDLQHVHLPEFFSEEERESLTVGANQMIKKASVVILSSKTSYDDLCIFAPNSKGKFRILHFVVPIPEDIYATDVSLVCKKYRLPEKFLFLPNQFWKHKNHNIVFEALAKLNKRGIKAFVVMTGFPHDVRNPEYFAELLQKTSTLNIRNQTVFLGVMPHRDVLLLMRQAVCVINPSLFEGWSTTVEEAKSLGKEIILSEIPIHREQDPPKAIFFGPNNSENLAFELERIWKDGQPGPSLEMEARARSILSDRINNFAESFRSILYEAIDVTM